MRILRVFLLSLLVVSAGCAGYLSETDSTAETETVAASDLPPGVSSQWVHDPGRLVEAHESSLDDANYRARTSVTANASEIGGFWSRTNRSAHVGTGIAVIRGRENGTSMRAYRTDHHPTRQRAVNRDFHPCGLHRDRNGGSKRDTVRPPRSD
ncbi:hypothetical protein [Haladaptatus sp. DFWS20]|uniref:hypothetical protein n=1 Tax=Haladaptatus sp. DFWS20 TaxID=3403467 RepID=UPI003EBBF4B9